LNFHSSKSRERIIVFGLILIYLLIACFWMGMSFYDDTMYMFWGRTASMHGFTHFVPDAPMYAMWFKVLSKVFHDPVWRYLFSWGSLVVLVSIIPLLFKVRLAWLYTLLVLIIPLYNITDYVSLFASMFVLAGMAAVLRWKLSVSGAACFACVACFLVGYIRPEFEPGTYIAAVIAVMAILFDRKRGSVAVIAVKVVTLLALCFVMSYSLKHSPGWRSGSAFAQHNNLRAHEKGLLPGDPWDSNYTEQLFHLDVDHTADVAVVTATDFYHANPKLFIGHILDNLRDFNTLRTYLLVLLLAGLPWCLPRYAALRASGLYLLVVSIPVLAAVVLIYPRPHYPMTVYPAMLMMFLQLWAEYRSSAEDRSTVPPAWRIILLGTLLIGLATVYHVRHWSDFDSNTQSNVAQVECLRGVERAEGAGNGRIYDGESLSDNDVYFDIPRKWVLPPGVPNWQVFMDWQTFAGWVKQTRPSWIVDGPRMTSAYPQPTLASFLTEDMGYTAHPCPVSTQTTVYTLQH
jgi:hypothetical protein